MKRGDATIETLLALLLVVVVVLALISYGPQIWELIKISIGLGEFDTNNLKEEKPMSKQEKEIKGKLAVLVIKMEDAIAKQKPTSQDHCLVGAIVKNTETTTWTTSDKIRITLFCNHVKNQIKNSILVQNYPVSGYVTDLKPEEQKEVLFAGRFPHNCLESFDKYQIILYSNCEGNGNQYEPCDNFKEADATKRPKILNLAEFNCKTD